MNLKLPSFELPSKETVVARSTSLSAWKLPKQSSSIAPEGVWTNSDQDPVPDSKRTWGMWAFTGYWFSDLVTVATWEVGSSILVVGLGTRDAILIMLIAGICNAVPTVLNGAFGADLRVPFPIAIRASYGYYFSYFCVVSRAILAAFWLGIQSVGGGTAVTQAITSIWPSYKNLPNHLSSSAGTTTQAMLSYFLYHVIQLPFLFIPMHKMQRMFFFKSLLVPPMAIGILIWICVKAGDANAILNQKATAKGSAHAWLWLASCTSVTGGFSTIAVNMSDFSRFSKTRGSQWTQLPVIPILKIVTALFGIVATGAARVAYGEDIWNPLELIAKWEGSGGRFLSFVCSCLWILAQISCNISANSVSFANDLTTLFPKWVNITRGTVICSIFGGFALVPWLVVANASTFLSFMSGYAVFLGPMAGIMMTDYWIVRNRKIDVPGLYDPNGRYYYKLGTNWRALITEFFVVAPLLPGLAYAIAPAHVHVSQGILNLYDINWFFGFPTSAFLYWILNVISPAKMTLVDKTIPGILELDGLDVEAVEVQSKDTGGSIVGDEKRITDVMVAKGDV